MRLVAWVLLILAFIVVGCGAESGEESGPPPPAETAASEEQDSPPVEWAGSDCGRVDVPGHEAVDLHARDVDCATAREVAAGAQGQGRAPYEAAGFACAPADAADGDTTYTCTGDAGRITFLYGVR